MLAARRPLWLRRTATQIHCRRSSNAKFFFSTTRHRLGNPTPKPQYYEQEFVEAVPAVPKYPPTWKYPRRPPLARPILRPIPLAFLGLFVGYMIYAAVYIDLPTEWPTDKADSPTPSLADRDRRAKRESGVTHNSSMRLRMEAFIKENQDHIIAELEKVDGKGKFRRDEWQRPHGGGGITCVLQDGNVFEKAGVNTSVVYGTLPPAAVQRMRADHKGIDPGVDSLEFFAAGLSLVLHPKNPMAPTVHLNYRYFETAGKDGKANAWWFGGGSDLTPCYLFDEDAIHFHKTIKQACDKHDRSYYPRFKKWCDQYFNNRHRGEARGVGGIFFDDLDHTEKDREQLFTFVQDCLGAFLPSYVPIIEKRKNMPFSDKEKEWQQIRRGRYVEFNLVHDRGTSFGLNTPGSRVESILMSLPLTARWEYDHHPKKGSREDRTLNVLKNPIEWV